MPKNLARSIPGRVPLPVGRAGFKPVGGRVGVFGRFDSCLFRSPIIHDSPTLSKKPLAICRKIRDKRLNASSGENADPRRDGG
jgi:hypothetical protein